MNLVLDVGNTRIKGAVYEGNIQRDAFVCLSNEISEKMEVFFQKHPQIKHLVLASVANFNEQVLNNVPQNISIDHISRDDKFPFVNKYASPNTLGIDRMVLASGATLRFPNQNRLVIDAGTAITYDYIDDKNQYWGGAISPGIKLRYEALHQFTAKLPLLEFAEPQHFIGNSTFEAIHSGVVNGVIHEIDGFINQYLQGNQNFTIILTGGDADFLAKRLKNTIFANSNFLLDSLNDLFQYQTHND
jgi:type III pantothenate kinase